MELEALIRRNYDGLIEPEECREKVLEFIANTESVSDRDILFIKRFTKVAHHVHKSYPDSFNGLLERLYQFNMDGIILIHKGRVRGHNKDNLSSISSHLQAYAGDVARAIFEKTGDVSWAKREYDRYRLSAEESLEFDLKHSAHAYSFAADVAQAIFEKTGDVSWAEKWYDSRKLSAKISLNFNPKHSAYSDGFAGDAAKAIFEKTGDISWAKRWYDCYILSAERSLEFNPKHSAHAYSFAADAAKAIFEKTGTIEWGKKNYASRIKAAQVSAEIDPKHSAYSYLFAGNVSDNLSKKTKKKKWVKLTIKYYQKFLDYHKSNPDPKMDEPVKRITSSIAFLKGRYGLN